MTTILFLVLLGAVVWLGRKVERVQTELDDLRRELLVQPLYDRHAAAAETAVGQGTAKPEPPATAELLEAHRPASTILHAEPREPEREAEPEPLAAEEHHSPKSEQDRPARLSFEELFGRRLPIWAGGITLAVAGFLIVKYSIEAGLISPALRVVAGLLFGGGLIAGAEVARRRAEWVRDPRVAQALSGAGIASLYGSVLVATNLYGLIGGGMAMAGMALITALALFLATRFGPPSALLGLAGGLAAPALIGSAEPNVPLLSLYLALAVGGLTALSRNQRWAWLGISALTGGFGWGLVLLLSGALDTPGTIALGLYMLVLGLLLPAVAMAGDHRARVQLVAAGMAGVQMAALVATGGFGAVEWVLFALLSAALQVLRWRDPQLAPLPPLGLLIAVLLTAVWPDPSRGELALVLAGAALIYGAPAAWRLWRPDGGLLEAGQLAGLALAALAMPLFHFYQAEDEGGFGLLAAALAAAGAGLAALGWRNPAHRADPRFVLLAIASALLLSAAGVLLLPEWLHAPWVAAVAVGLLEVSRRAGDLRLELAGWAFGAISILMLIGYDATGGDVLRMGGMEPNVSGTSALRWLALAIVAGLFAWRARHEGLRGLAQLLVVPLAYAGLAQMTAPAWLPLLAAAMLVAAAVAVRRVGQPRLIGGALVPLSGWVLAPLAEWGLAGAMSLGGEPMLLNDVPSVEDALTRLLAPAGAMAAALRLLGPSLLQRHRRILGLALGVLTLVGLHSLSKHLFSIDDLPRFVSRGLAERLVWAGLLVAGGAVLWRGRQARAGLALLAATAAYHVGYTLLLHNPLWASQAVGGWPIVNLLLPTYGLPLAALVLAERQGVVPERFNRAVQVGQMLLVALFAVSTVRQLFHGSLLVGGGVDQAEDIAWSIGAIALAIGFLLWGIRTRRRDWRIASLALMLGAVAKVFLLDASGLEGLTRIASFVALGFSLIGIGWLYARQLRSEEPASAAATV